MNPNAPQVPLMPSGNLPPVAPPAPAAAPTSVQPPVQAAGVAPSAQAIAAAKQLVQQYNHDPFRLSGALQQLKAAYIADQYHVTSNPAEH